MMMKARFNRKTLTTSAFWIDRFRAIMNLERGFDKAVNNFADASKDAHKIWKRQIQPKIQPEIQSKISIKINKREIDSQKHAN